MKSISINRQNKKFKKKYAFLLNQINQAVNREPRSSQHHYLKKVNAAIENLYRKSAFCENEEFLYWRYCVLESVCDVNRSLLTPWAIGMLGSALVSALFDLSSINSTPLSASYTASDTIAAIFAFLIIAFSFGGVTYLIFYFFWESQRTLDQTIQENEMSIIHAILEKHGIFLAK